VVVRCVYTGSSGPGGGGGGGASICHYQVVSLSLLPLLSQTRILICF
jgi:hypothetical protein